MVRAAHVSVASIKNLNLKIIPWGESTPTVSKVSTVEFLHNLVNEKLFLFVKFTTFSYVILI